MIQLLILLLMLKVILCDQYQGCVNSCCQHCSQPDHCSVCYNLNNNPVMCPCIDQVTGLEDNLVRRLEDNQVRGFNL